MGLMLHGHACAHLWWRLFALALLLFVPAGGRCVAAQDAWQPALAARATVAGLAWSRRRPALHEGLLLLGFTYFALHSARNISLFALMVAPVLAALRATMLLESEQAGRFLYVPRRTRAGAGGNSCGPLRQGDPPPWP